MQQGEELQLDKSIEEKDIEDILNDSDDEL